MWAIIKKYLGWRNWAVFTYNSIFENLFVIFYIGLRTQNFSDDFLIDIVIFLLFSIFSTTYGYLINDYADMELDRAHGKPNTFEKDSKVKAFFVSIIFLLISIVCGMHFSANLNFALIWLFWIAISTFYSMPPIRLKERGKAGLLLVVVAQRLLPILLVFTAFNFTEGWEIVLLATYVFFRGASSDINHQLEDYENDIATGTATYTVKKGKSKVEKILRFSLESEKILLVGILILAAKTLIALPVLLYIFLLLSFTLYLLMYFSSIVMLLKKEVNDVNPFKPSGSSVFQFLHHSYPTVIFTITLNIVLIYYNWHFFLIFVTIGALRGLFSISMIKNSFIFKTISRMVRSE